MRRKLTPAEIRAYRDMARAAARLRRAQARAERQREQGRGAAPTNPPDVGGESKGAADEC
jgi:hypothetical protein